MQAVTILVSVAVVLLYLTAATDAALRAAVITPGKCPKVAGQATLDAKRYIGKWYEYQRFPAIFEAGLQCTSAEYGLKPDGSISVTNKGLLRVTVFGKTYIINRSSINGNATVPDPSKPAELSVAFFGQPGNTPNYFIQETDYENYSVVFSCVDIELFNVQFAWILTRQRGVAPANLSDLYAKLETAKVDTSNFFTVNNVDCPPNFN